MAEPVFATEAQKRALCDDMLQDYLDGENALAVKLARLAWPAEIQLQLHIEPADREALLARVMREPTRDAIVRSTTALLCSQRPPWDTEATKLEREMLKEERPRVTLHFHCFAPPEGDAWAEFYDAYATYLLEGTDNKAHLLQALSERWPLEVGYSLYDGKMQRFVVLPPYSPQQQGARIVVK